MTDFEMSWRQRAALIADRLTAGKAGSDVVPQYL